MGKLKLLFGLLVFEPVWGLAQSSTENYVKTTTMLDANNNNKMTSVQYYNGLGYPTVSVSTTGDGGQTTYSLVTYDGLGRESRKYVPVSKDNSILYKAPGTISLAYTDNTPYSQTSYDALDRPISVTTPGAAFASRPSTIAYAANAANEVICYGVSSSNSLTQNGYYPANSLTKETTTDPDGKKTETFKDLLGNTVMQRSGGSLCTYYVYDNLNLLRFVLPPKYQTDKNLAATCYEYRYDYRGRVSYKQLPGAGYVEYWYDNADRMIFMRDAEMRSAGKYRFYIYDKFNHLVVQGICSSRPSSTAVFDATLGTSGGLLGTGYSYPSGLGTIELEIANYYDGSQSGNSRFSSLTLTATSVSQRGLQTGVVTIATNGDQLVQAMQYDIKGNVVNSKAKDIGGRIVSNTSSYSYTNQLTQSTTTIGVGYGGNLTVTETVNYNPHNNQKASDAITVNHGTAKSATINFTHDNLGRLSNVARPTSSSTNRDVSYTYDLRSWTTNISTSTFTEELFYADGPGTAYYNGNISSIRWKDNSQSAKRGYKFSYDTANRLTSGAYGEGDALGSNTGRYSESMSYDANGNITSLTRYGKGTLMDNLTISYTGNQPTSVSESASDNNTSGSFEYKKANGSGYIFNANGALVADKSRGIAYITYDYNNNPKQIYFTNGSVTKYVYSASGQKLRVVHYTAKPNITRTWGEKPAELTMAQILQADSTDYLMGGSLTMKNGRIDKYLFDGGYAQASVANSTTDNFAFYFYNQDHLGNIREVVNASGSVQQVTNYYPFGAPYADIPAATNPDFQPYKYNGKELDKMHGLNTYDYGARQHDPILARWDRIDPLAEKYYNVSPYAYCENSPVRYIDPNGEEFTESSLKYVNMLTNNISTRIDNNTKKIAKLQAKVNGGGLSEKKVKTLQNRIKKIEANSMELKGVQEEINILKQSSQLYDIALDDSRNNANMLEKEVNSVAYFNHKNNVFEIRLGDSSLGLMAHELKHAYQFEIGAFSTGVIPNGTPFYDQSDEWEAYKRGELFGGERLSALPSMYSGLQVGPIDYKILNPMILSDLQNFAKHSRSAFRVNGVTYNGIR